MSNDHIKSEISPYLAGGLTESRNRQIEAHAAACEKCRGALAKARAKQARVKREALKKASPDPMPNLFLARQGKDIRPDSTSGKSWWLVGSLCLLAGLGYWGMKQYSPFFHSAPAPISEPKPAPVETSSAPIVNVKPTPPTPPVVVATSVALQVQQEWRGVESGIKESRLVVIRKKEGWAKLWAEMQAPQALPEINFSQHVVIGVFAGEKPGGASISMGKIIQTDDGVFASYSVTAPRVDVSTRTAQPPSHPYLLALIPRVDKRIRLTPEEAPR